MKAVYRGILFGILSALQPYSLHGMPTLITLTALQPRQPRQRHKGLIPTAEQLNDF